uniref:Uncharacterized protein n=1 Tax=Romanomermis culicivorax TaxID=13658 RepID=A0A915IVR7_ROMCU
SKESFFLYKKREINSVGLLLPDGTIDSENGDFFIERDNEENTIKVAETGSKTELEKDHMETKIKKLEDQTGTIARTVEHLERV